MVKPSWELVENWTWCFGAWNEEEKLRGCAVIFYSWNTGTRIINNGKRFIGFYWLIGCKNLQFGFESKRKTALHFYRRPRLKIKWRYADDGSKKNVKANEKSQRFELIVWVRRRERAANLAIPPNITLHYTTNIYITCITYHTHDRITFLAHFFWYIKFAESSIPFRDVQVRMKWHIFICVDWLTQSQYVYIIFKCCSQYGSIQKFRYRFFCSLVVSFFLFTLSSLSINLYFAYSCGLWNACGHSIKRIFSLFSQWSQLTQTRTNSIRWLCLKRSNYACRIGRQWRQQGKTWFPFFFCFLFFFRMSVEPTMERIQFQLLHVPHEKKTNKNAYF